MTTKPTGTVTLLFSDIEDSTSRLAELGADQYRVAKAVGERPLINRARIGLLQVLVALGDLDTVEPMAREALADAERQDDLRSAHFAHHFLADCALIRGDAASAGLRYRPALELAIQLGDRYETAFEIQGVAMAAAGMSLAARALRLGGAAAAELDALAIDYTGIRFWSVLLDRYLGRARSELGAEAADAAWQEGRRTDFESAISETLADRTLRWAELRTVAASLLFQSQACANMARRCSANAPDP